ncbi:MAG: hypothetical protein H0X34_12470 [Chthoniobacterales bacterium]|nr:hypothetical protein [Chthoniobacterales bacterium]
METHLLLEECLALLQKVDRQQHWYSLDDKRVCIDCQQIFSGRQIEVLDRGNNGISLHCPTPDCLSDSTHWLLWQPAPAKEADEPKEPAESEFSFL